MLLSSSVVFAKISEDHERIAPPLSYFPHLRVREASEWVQCWYNTRGNQQDIIWERAEGLELISILGLDQPKSVDNSVQVFLRHVKKPEEEFGQ